MADLSDSIASNAAGPKRVKGDQGEVEQHSLPDQIAADKYAKTNASVAVGGWPFRVQKGVAGGAQ